MNYWRCGLTSLVGSDVDWCILGWIRALVRYSVDSLDFKCVLGVGQQFTYEDPGVCESKLAWNELNIVPTTRAAPSAASAALADDVVDNVITTASFPRRIPLQHQWSLVHTGDDVLRSRRHSWKKKQYPQIIFICELESSTVILKEKSVSPVRDLMYEGYMCLIMLIILQ